MNILFVFQTGEAAGVLDAQRERARAGPTAWQLCSVSGSVADVGYQNHSKRKMLLMCFENDSYVFHRINDN